MNAPAHHFRFADACQIVQPDYRVAAMERANAAIARGTRGCLPAGGPRSEAYAPPVDPPRCRVSEKVRTDNAAGLARYVAGALAVADTMSPERARDHLFARAQRLHGYLALFDGDAPLPAHLVGLDAFQIANARDQLDGEATRKSCNSETV